MEILLPPSPCYALFSGGKDSFALACALEEQGFLRGVVLLDTGISADTWREDVLKIIESRQWPYEIVPTSYRYEAYVYTYGFPGPGKHGEVMTYLKGRAIRLWKKKHPGESLASGVRQAESGRRQTNAVFQSQWEGVTVYAPILKWSTAETWAYVRARGYERPRTYLTLGISGDCLCGAFAQEHEPGALEEHCPKAAARIAAMTPGDGYGWGQRAIDKIDKTLDLYTDGEAVACFDCARTNEANP